MERLHLESLYTGTPGDRVYVDEGQDHVGTATLAYQDNQILQLASPEAPATKFPCLTHALQAAEGYACFSLSSVCTSGVLPVCQPLHRPSAPELELGRGQWLTCWGAAQHTRKPRAR